MTLQASIEVLNQLNGLLSQLKSEEYNKKLVVLNGSSIGQHVRHTIEFFECLLDGLKTGIIDYDARKRNLLLETNLDYTLDIVDGIQQKLQECNSTHKPILIAINYAETENELIETSFMRELVYLIEHSIHHFALIRIGIQENFKEIFIESNFGVAYSTIKHQKELVECNN